MQKRIKTAANEQSLEFEPGERTMQSRLASFSTSAPGGGLQTHQLDVRKQLRFLS